MWPAIFGEMQSLTRAAAAFKYFWKPFLKNCLRCGCFLRPIMFWKGYKTRFLEYFYIVGDTPTKFLVGVIIFFPPLTSKKKEKSLTRNKARASTFERNVVHLSH